MSSAKMAALLLINILSAGFVNTVNPNVTQKVEHMQHEKGFRSNFKRVSMFWYIGVSCTRFMADAIPIIVSKMLKFIVYVL